MNSFLTASQVDLLKKSFRQLDTQAYSDYFYSTLFARHAEIQNLFPKDISELKLKLMSVFELIMFSFEEKQNGQYALQDALIVPLRHLGKTHEEKGVKPAHYSIANGLMLEALAHVLGDSYTEEIKQSWKTALSHVTSAMLNNSIRLNTELGNESGVTLREAFNKILGRIKGHTQ